MVPYLVDPNANMEMFESADIVAYLEATYAL
jgi:glutathione S-transferase